MESDDDPKVPRMVLTVLLRVPACPSWVLLKNPELSRPVMSMSRVLLQPPPVSEMVLVLATRLLRTGVEVLLVALVFVVIRMVPLLSAMFVCVHR